ncbi:hypothetical protein BX661DRAFT_202747 [Kickxella alabastrina]|uniref:uncharacterized protein n=1 Tax=Kickxella alabastrina TaxID=61397 RepID=UPI00221F6477|nr:uncharacterized protein BX661DRAFT_202747 [Kickxella alabastrina]KAI7835029.1 hypothetical protein BX661DRAFT_202747 [Kickxella alabastrina]
MAEEEDYSALPLEQRLIHKVWKVRMGAYTDLTKELKQLDPDKQAGQFNMYENYLAKMVLDTNMAAQEAGITTVIAFVENAPNPTRRREEIISGIVSKCLSATKAGTRTQSIELLLLLSEVDTPAPVVTGILEGFDAKQPKALAAAVMAVKDLVHAFGVKFISLKPLLKALAKPFSNKDNSVRTEAQHLAVELYRWMGPAIMPALQDLPPVLLKELETQFSATAGGPPPKQQRLLRSQQEVEEPEESAVGAGADSADVNDEDAGEESADMDPWDLADPVDITKKLPDDYQTFVVSSKWKERKEVIEQLHTSLKKNIRLQMSPGTSDIIQELGKKIGDTNIVVATLAIQSLGLFASGLRQAFSPYVQSTLPALIEKSKERKQTVIDAIRETVDAFFKAIGGDLSAIGDHYFTGATHKNPQARAESNHMLRRFLAVTPTRPGKGDVKRYADHLKTGLDDGDAGVRESAAECLGTMSKLVTAKLLDPFIEGVDKIKLEKINEYAEKATIKAKAPVAAKPKPTPVTSKPRPRPAGAAPAGPARAAPPAAAASGSSEPVDGLSANLPPHIRMKLEASARAAAIKKAQREGKPIDDLLPPAPAPAAAAAPRAAPPTNKRPAGPAPPQAPRKSPAAVAAAAAAAAAKPGAKGKPAAAGKDAGDAVKMRFANDDSLDENIAGAIPEGVLTGFDSAKWKDRVEAMDQLKEHLGDQAASGSGVHPELVVRQLGRKPGWKESNFQVGQRMFQLIEWMAGEEDLEFNTGAAALCAAALVDKLGDIKLKGPASSALVAIAQRFSLKFVLGLVIEPIRSQKSPKVLADCLAWLDTQMVEFGPKGLALRPVVEMVKEVGLQSSNAQTRAKAVSFMGTLRRAVGAVVMDLMGDLNPQLLQLIEAEFERVANQPLPAPIHTQRSLAGDASGGTDGGGGGASASVGGSASDDPLDDLFPRQDLHAIVGPNIYKLLNDSNWKERKAGLDTLQGALDSANHRILPNISGDLYTALKQRLQDPNKNLITLTLGLLGALSTDSAAAQVPNVRIVALPTMNCLSDKKPQLRMAALGAMTAWAEASAACVDQAVLPSVPNALSDTSPELRSSLLQWVTDVMGSRVSKGGRLPDLSALITPLFSCLQDRNAEVRKQANRVLELTVSSCGFDTVYDACSMQLNGAAKAAVLPMIDEFRHTAGGDGGSAGRRPAGPSAPGRARLGALAHSSGAGERATSPVVESVMTASELLGRAAGTSQMRSGSAATNASPSAPAAPGAASGPGMLRRPMAVRKPAGSAPAPAPGIGGTRAMRPGARGPTSAGGSADVSRPGSSMRAGTPTLQSTVGQMARMSNEDLENIPPILDSDPRAKDARARRDMAGNPNGIPRWAQLGDARVRAELEAQLCDHAAAHFNPLIQRQLFSTGHYKDRDYLGGLTTMDEAISIPTLSQQRFGIPLFAESPDMDSLAARYMANIDILLKYISMRMYDGSTHTLLKSFDLLERLIQLTEEIQQNSQQQSQASWSDYEVQAVLPALVSRLGDAKEVVRGRARRMLTQLITHLYPTTKLFNVLLEYGVTNRNNARIRQESLDAICFLIRERTAGCGLSAVCAQPSRAVPVIVQGIADRDSSVRTATLNVLVAVGEQLPGGADELWRLCGRMAEKERTMLEEKIKRSSIATETVSVPRPGSRIGAMAPAAGPRARIGSSLARPASQASGNVGSLSRNSVIGGIGAGIANGIGAGASMGANRLSRPAGLPAPSGVTYGSDVGGASGSSVGYAAHGGSARPMFTLDFDKLNLPSYSAATTEQLNNPASARGMSARPLVSSPPISNAMESFGTGSGFGASRNAHLQSALSGMQIGAAGNSGGDMGRGVMHQMARSPIMSASSQSMSALAFVSPRTAADFSHMSEPERDEWMESIVADISGDDSKAAEKAIERLRELFETFARPTDEEKRNPQMYMRHIVPAHLHIRKNLGNLVSGIAMQIRWAFTTTSTDPTMQSPFHRTLSHIRRITLDVLTEIFANFYFSLWVPLDAIQTLFEELVRRLVDPATKNESKSRIGRRSSGGEAGNDENLSRRINTILVKILDNADRTTVYVALMQLYESAMAEPAPNPPQTDSDILRMAFGDMAQKCLWRLTKDLAQDLERQFGACINSSAMDILPEHVANPEFGNPALHPAIRVDPLFRMTHRFFVRVPVREWRRRSDRDVWMFGDLPKRTMKTINHTLVTYLQSFSWQFGGLIIRDVMESNPGLIPPPPDARSNADPALINWVNSANEVLKRHSETWEYINLVAGQVDPLQGCPLVEQMMAAMRVAQTASSGDHDDFSDDDSDVVMAGPSAANSYQQHQYQYHQQQQQQQGPRGSYSGSVTSGSSPYQQHSWLSTNPPPAINSGNIERAQSPGAFSSNSRMGGSQMYSAGPMCVTSPQPFLPSIPTAPAAPSNIEPMTSQGRLQALRARILSNQQHPDARPNAPSPVLSNYSTSSTNTLVGTRRTVPLANNFADGTNLDDIRARIALMRSSVRNNTNTNNGANH